MTYEQLLSLLRDLHPDIDFETAEGLIPTAWSWGPWTSCPRTSTAPGPSSP